MVQVQPEIQLHFNHQPLMLLSPANRSPIRGQFMRAKGQGMRS
jgi:hypothetical protein